MAKLTNFDYTSHDAPVRRGLEAVVGEAVFCISGEGEGYDERSIDFWDALGDFKNAIPGRLRVWDDDEKLWIVQVTHSVKEMLLDLFTNAEGLFEDAERQLSFW